MGDQHTWCAALLRETHLTLHSETLSRRGWGFQGLCSHELVCHILFPEGCADVSTELIMEEMFSVVGTLTSL